MALELPSSSLEVISGGLGVGALPPDAIPVVIGISSKGPSGTNPANKQTYISTPYSYGKIADLKSGRGNGRAVKKLAYLMSKANVSGVFQRVPATARDAEVSDVEGGTDVLHPVVTGTPLDSYSFIWKWVSTAITAAAGYTESAVEPFNLEPAQNVVVRFEAGGDQTFAIDAAAASVLSADGPFTLTNGMTIIIGGETRAISTGEFADIGNATNLELIPIYNALFLAKSLPFIAMADGDKLKITSVKRGTDAAIVIGAGTINSALAGTYSTGTVNGTGDVGDIDAATAAEVVAACSGITNGTATVVSGKVRFTSATTGGSSTAQVKNTSTALGLGFDNAVHTGVAGVAGTVGTTGITYKYSFDGGETFTDVTALGTALSVALGDTGMTLAFDSGDAPETTDDITWTTIAASASITPPITSGGAGTTSEVTLSGSPVDAYEGRFQFLKGGTIGVAGMSYRYSLDGGRTWTRALKLATASSVELLEYALDGTTESTGVTLALGAGDIVAGFTVAFKTTAPEAQNSDIVAALEALKAAPTSLGWSFVCVDGESNADTGIAVGTKLAAFANDARYTFAILAARDRRTYEPDETWRLLLKADVADFNDNRIAIGAGFRRITCPITARRNRRPFAWPTIARVLARPFAEDPGRVLTGLLPSDVELTEDGIDVEHDARLNDDLQAARYICARTYVEEAGLFVTAGWMMAVEGSDIMSIPLRRVMDLASLVVRREMNRQILNGLRVQRATDPKPGTIRELDAQSIELECTTKLRDALISDGSASDAFVEVSREDLLLTNGGVMHYRCGVTPLGYVKKVIGAISFQDPRLAALKSA